MTEEGDVVGFLRSVGGEATLEEVAVGLGLPKYGPRSAYSLLHSLRTRRIVDRRGEKWVLVARETAIRKEQPLTVEEKHKTVEAPSGFEQLMEVMAKTLTEAVKSARKPSDEWELATKPMKTEIEEERKALSNLVLKPDIAPEAKKELIALPTGTFLDDLFLTPEGKPLGGLPICGQFAITGLPGSGKSILVEEIAVRASSPGRKVLFVTAEDTWKSPTPRFDLQSRMKQKADILGLDWESIRENLFILDTVLYPELRDWNNFAETYRYVVEKEGIELAIIDSVTILEAYRGALKYRVMELARYNQIHGVTGLFVNQRSAETWDSYGMAGGIGLSHNLDGTIIVDYGRVYWMDQQVDLEMKRGEFVRIARILDCRLSNFERRRVRIDITPEGFIRPVRPSGSAE
ncbi:MAG: RAD55 family ATPase [Candidatus Bathyarchaeia archaeon]